MENANFKNLSLKDESKTFHEKTVNTVKSENISKIS